MTGMWLAALVIGLALPEAKEERAVEFISHRGESAGAPENTLAAIRLAWERKVPAVELDVHLTRDGALAVCHDADTLRTTGVRKLIRESTMAELRALDAGAWKGARWKGEPVPTLKEALATIPESGRCFIEIKVGPEAVPALSEAVRTCGKPAKQLVVISFNADTIAEAKRRLPQLKAYYLSSFKKDPETGAWTPSIESLIARAKEIRADGLNLSHNGPVDAAAVKKIKDAGLAMYVWTVDSADVARRMIGAGVDGITSNRAAALRDALNAR